MRLLVATSSIAMLGMLCLAPVAIAAGCRADRLPFRGEDAKGQEGKLLTKPEWVGVRFRVVRYGQDRHRGVYFQGSHGLGSVVVTTGVVPRSLPALMTFSYLYRAGSRRGSMAFSKKRDVAALGF